MREVNQVDDALRKGGRDTWLFEVESNVVLTACKQRIKHHTARLEYWKHQRQDWFEKLKADGIIFDADEQFDKLYAAASNTYAQRGLRMDQEIVAKVNEADKKVKEHEQHVRDYSAWSRTLLQVEGKLLLRHADILYFDIRPESEAP